MGFSLWSMHSWFWVLALGGSALYVTRFAIAAFFGLDGDIDFDSDALGHLDTESSFGFLSFASLAGFAMFFGWGGLAAYEQFQLGSVVSLVFAVFCGSLSFLLTFVIGALLTRLKNPGDTYSIKDALGYNGTVYQQIPEGGSGRIQVTVGGLLREIDAVADEMVQSGAHVVVLEVINATTVKVKKS